MSRRSQEFLKSYYEDQETSWSNPKTLDKPLQPARIWRQPVNKQRLKKRTLLALLLLFSLAPLVLWWGIHSGGRHYLTVSLLLLALASAPFFLLFEGRRPQVRELMVIAVLVALAVVGRGVFFMLPQFKPVAAIVIISGISFGGEAGFLVGSLAALVSNIFFTQGPWTPWQMLAFGLIGFFAGIFYRWGWLKTERLALSLFGFFSIFILYGGIMNPASLVMYLSEITPQSLAAIFISGAPMDLVHALSTVVFLNLLAKPILEKLERVKVKYGLISQEENEG